MGLLLPKYDGALVSFVARWGLVISLEHVQNIYHLAHWELRISPNHVENTCHLSLWGLRMLPKYVEK